MLFGMNPDHMDINQLMQMGLWPQPLPVNGIIPYIRRIPEDDVIGLETGCLKGDNACVLLTECPKVTLYSIDDDLPFTEGGHETTVVDMQAYQKVRFMNVLPFHDRFKFFDSLNKKVSSPKLRDLDFIFLNSPAHRLGDDLEQYYSKVRPGGYVFGTKYNLGETRKALYEWREKNCVRIPIKISSNNVWFWRILK
jgi:hypothetical protein